MEDSVKPVCVLCKEILPFSNRRRRLQSSEAVLKYYSSLMVCHEVKPENLYPCRGCFRDMEKGAASTLSTLTSHTSAVRIKAGNLDPFKLVFPTERFVAKLWILTQVCSNGINNTILNYLLLLYS